MNNFFSKFLIYFALLWMYLPASGQQLRTEIKAILDESDGLVGVGVVDFETNESIYFNAQERFPMQSVFKFPLALAVLQRVDAGEWSLDMPIEVTPADLLPNTWSPIRERYPNGNITLTLAEIIRYTVAQSDNNGCDILFRLLDGPIEVNKAVAQMTSKGIAIVADEAGMAKGWDVQFGNYSTPVAMMDLFQKFWAGRILSPASTEYLKKVLFETNTCEACMKGLLPKGAQVAHKTGRSATNAKGITAATNDAGVLLLPNGKAVGLVIFVSNSKASDSARERLIARISKAVWDQYSQLK
ncbi:class A beta-lactamase, subclass A2 [Dyadobacter tibetensis]|uniref:class A beta-lactamase, subclass A2 n=1 Tax=Dyadobacter tibetensis TaxID=1211851 RepID=UPI0004B8871E|nr:class A beta-lactamase, subclass A2 [Dyadobacter tibetensis]